MKWNNPVSWICIIFASKIKNQLTMLQFLKLITIFALSVNKNWRLRGERLSLGKSAHTLCEVES